MSGQMEFETLVTKLIDVYGISDKSTIHTIIEYLNQAHPTQTYFTDLCTSLPAMNVHEEVGLVEFYKKGSSANVVNVKPIGQGAFGTIYKSVINPHIYKKLVIESTKPANLEKKAREFFLEAFIQTLMSNDPIYGKNICKIFKIFRSINTVRKTGGVQVTKLELFIQMEIMKKNLGDAINEEKPFPITKALPFFNKLNSILGHFKDLYNFNHRDLHVGNIMFRDDDVSDPVLIDFGMSCLTYNGKIYSIIPENITSASAEQTGPLRGAVKYEACESVDLLILLTSLVELDYNNMDELTKIFLIEVSTANTGDKFMSILFNSKNELKDAYKAVYKSSKPAVFHLIYPYLWMNKGDMFHDIFEKYLPFRYLSDHGEMRKFICSFANEVKKRMMGGRRKPRRTVRGRRKQRKTRRHQ
jgi:serine/threonine protein kinase